MDDFARMTAVSPPPGRDLELPMLALPWLSPKPDVQNLKP